MQPKRGKLPGLVGKAKISSGNTMHIPNRVMSYFSMQMGDTLEFYNPLVDMPEDLVTKFELIAVVVKRKSLAHIMELDDKGKPKKLDGLPIVKHPFEGPQGKKFVRTTK